MRKILKSIKPIIISIFTITIVIAITTAATIAVRLFKKNPKKAFEKTATISESISNSKLNDDSQKKDNIKFNEKERKISLNNKSKNIFKKTSAQIKNVSKKESNTLQQNTSNNFSDWNKSCESNLIIVNKDNELPENFNPNLSTAMGISNNLNVIMIGDLQKMFSDAKKAGMNLYISSGYRSIAHQQKLFNNKVSYYIKKGYSKKDAEIEAAKVVARPKTSEHHTGLAIDLNGVRDDFYKTKEFKWLTENAQNYGFILRYPKDKINKTNVIFEPWHFRYVGIKTAKIMTSKNMCLEEYIEFLNNK